MQKLVKCAFNMDTACVELRFSDGGRIDIDTVGVENEVADICISAASWIG